MTVRDDRLVVKEEFVSIFNIIPVRNIGKDTMIEVNDLKLKHAQVYQVIIISSGLNLFHVQLVFLECNFSLRCVFLASFG